MTKSYDRYPGENCIVPTPSDGPSVSGLETELTGLPAATIVKKFTPVYNAIFYGTRTERPALAPDTLRFERAREGLR